MRKELEFETIQLTYDKIPIATLDCLYDPERYIGEVKLYPILDFNGVYYKSPSGISLHIISYQIQDIFEYLTKDIANDIKLSTVSDPNFYQLAINTRCMYNFTIFKHEKHVYINAYNAQTEEMRYLRYSHYLDSYIIEEAIGNNSKWWKNQIVHSVLFKFSDISNQIELCNLNEK